jgi:hypothetical protein
MAKADRNDAFLMAILFKMQACELIADFYELETLFYKLEHGFCELNHDFCELETRV